MKREFTIYKEGKTDRPITILSKEGVPFDRTAKMKMYTDWGYTVNEILN